MLPRARLFSILMFICGCLDEPAIAQQLAPLVPLPQLKTCSTNVHPRLPENWHGIFLMTPFTNAQLVLSEIAYDASLPAMRIKLYGLRSGALDLLIDGSETI